MEYDDINVYILKAITLGDIMFKFIKRIFGEDERFGKRSSDWRKVRDEFVKENPYCAACCTKNKLEVHHIKPYHIAPELELEKTNLITLCRNHHFTFGHFCDWTSWNIDVEKDVKDYFDRRVERPHKEDTYDSQNPVSITDILTNSFFSWYN